jgi:ubiquinone/menaquinone biosynthesis C-methylase UbiE
MPKSPSPKFWNRIAENTPATRLRMRRSYKKKLEITRTYLAPDHRVLEFGCGTGGTALKHAPHVAQIDATDLSPKMIEIAERRAVEAGATNVTFAVASVEGFTAPDESYDVVLGLSLLHLLDDRQSAIAKIYRLLKPGGVFVSSTACIADMNGLLRYVIPWARSSATSHTSRCSPAIASALTSLPRASKSSTTGGPPRTKPCS